jgi:K+-transporting ATPase ATPase B chain
MPKWLLLKTAVFIKFTAETRSSGLDTPDGLRIRKGAFDSIRNIALKAGNAIPY